MTAESAPAPPYALLAELTHRCPLRCPYCSNPEELIRRSSELDTAQWKKVLSDAAEAGVLQVHFSGGEPTARHDIEELVGYADSLGLYTNLITSGVLTDSQQLARLAQQGLAHVQLSIQDANDDIGDWVAGYAGAQQKKRQLAQQIDECGLALTINAVIHRHNIDRVCEMIDLAVSMGAQRVEVANVQYYGWGIRNRKNLMPTVEQTRKMHEQVQSKIKEMEGVIVIDYVVPDYYARKPKACMNGWARQFVNVSPEGKVLPCHAAETMTDLVFENIKDKSLIEIWHHSEAFNRYRGTEWMREPCRSCDRREIDWGGCRCQALALTGDARNADPVCELVPGHEEVVALALSDSSEASASVNEGFTQSIEFDYRGFSKRPS